MNKESFITIQIKVNSPPLVAGRQQFRCSLKTMLAVEALDLSSRELKAGVLIGRGIHQCLRAYPCRVKCIIKILPRHHGGYMIAKIQASKAISMKDLTQSFHVL